MNANEIKAALEIIIKGRRFSFTVCSPKTSDNSKHIQIINSHEVPGRHWLLIWRLRDKYFFYDSYGKSFTSYFRNKKIKTIENCVAHQNDNTASCGYFVLYVVYYLVRKVPIKKIMCKFKNDKMFNEKLVLNFFNKIKPYFIQSKHSINRLSCCARTQY